MRGGRVRGRGVEEKTVEAAIIRENLTKRQRSQRDRGGVNAAQSVLPLQHL